MLLFEHETLREYFIQTTEHDHVVLDEGLRDPVSLLISM